MRQITTIMTAILAAGLLVAGSAEAAKRYDIRSGYIKYETSQGTEELYWDNYGDQEARYTDSTVTVFGMTQSNQSVNIIDGRWAYNFDKGSNKASKIDHELMMKQMSGSKAQQPREFTEQMLDAFGGEKLGTEKILGRKATIYKLNNIGDYKVWVYKGLALKAEMQMMGFSYEMQAIEFKENANIDQAKLRLPSGMEIAEVDPSDMPSAEEIQQARDTMKNLQNDPEMADAMRQFKEMQNDPEAMKAMRQMQDFTGSPEYKDAMKAAAGSQQVQNAAGNEMPGEDLVEEVGGIIKDETGSAVKSTIRDTTRDVIGGGLRSIFGN